MLVAMTVGHVGRPSKEFKDLGAAQGSNVEADFVRRYVHALERAFRKLGVQSATLSDGSYADQWARADAYGADVYLNCHMNAGGGDRGEFFYDHRSTKGKALADNVVAALGKAFPWTNRAVACHPDTNGVPRDADYSEAFGCIYGVKAPALVVEAYFIDGPDLGEFDRRMDEWAGLVAGAIAQNRGA